MLDGRLPVTHKRFSAGIRDRSVEKCSGDRIGAVKDDDRLACAIFQGIGQKIDHDLFEPKLVPEADGFGSELGRYRASGCLNLIGELIENATNQA